MLKSINIKKLTSHTLTGILLAGSFVIQSSQNKALAATPDTNWSPTNTMEDCWGMGAQSYNQTSTTCQKYNEDLYENWNPNGDLNGDDTDIKTFSVGEDDTYFYFEIDLREPWTSESREYYLEIEADGDGQPDYFLAYQPKSDDLGSSWKDIGGKGEIEVYEDQNNSVGGSDLTGPDVQDPDGYEAEVSPNKNLTPNDFFVRLVNGDVQMALKKNRIGSPSNILSRAYAAQNTNLENNALTWHDWQYSGALSDGFDNTAGADTSTWLELNPPSSSCSASNTAITLTGTIRDFQASHPDFEFNLNDGDSVWWHESFAEDRGIVTDTIGANKKPVYAHGSGSTVSTSGESNFNQWYNDVSGVNQSKEHSITLTQVNGMYQYSSDNFFPINDDLYGNIDNDPYITAPTSGWMNDQWNSGKKNNNYHFTYEIHNSFTYQGGETFTFEGDDDVWVYINGKKVIDIGGVHGEQTQTVNLDDVASSLGLVINGTYDFDFFFAERNFSGSNFTITTCIELEPQIITNQPPHAEDDHIVAYYQPTLNLDVLANDTDPDNPNESLTINPVIHNVTGGTAQVINGKIAFTPTFNSDGIYNLQYTCSDSSGAISNLATVTINLMFGD